MNTAWFIILALMLTIYAVLDGFDFGVGAVFPWLCRNDKERDQALGSIGPVWNGNEVWLIAAGGTMFAAFPRLYAASFSGFYLALMLVLWLLILRGVGFEFRHQHESPLWRGLWEVVFSGSSLLLAVLFGVALGNVLRGVPLDANGEFTGSFTLLLNPFAILAGVLSLTMLCLHGAAYLAMKSEGALNERARRLVGWLWPAVVILLIAFVWASTVVQPGFAHNFIAHPVLLALPALAMAALAAIRVTLSKKQDIRLFLASALTITTLLGSAATGLFPQLLPDLWNHVGRGLTIYNAASTSHSLVTALIANIIGMTIVTGYTAYIYKVWSGKTVVAH